MYNFQTTFGLEVSLIYAAAWITMVPLSSCEIQCILHLLKKHCGMIFNRESAIEKSDVHYSTVCLHSYTALAYLELATGRGSQQEPTEQTDTTVVWVNLVTVWLHLCSVLKKA